MLTATPLPIKQRGASHFLLAADVPARFEVTVTPNGTISVFAYSGAITDIDQEPMFFFDGSRVEKGE